MRHMIHDEEHDTPTEPAGVARRPMTPADVLTCLAALERDSAARRAAERAERAERDARPDVPDYLDVFAPLPF